MNGPGMGTDAMRRLEGKIALVTGGARGIGLAIARALTAQGAVPVLADINEEGARQALAGLGAPDGMAAAVDVADQASVTALIEAIVARYGRLDILVNNAGVTKDNLFLRLKDEDWDSVIAINLTAAFRLSRAAVKSMMRRRYGRIISIGSVVGTTGNPGQGNYAASKAGLIGMSKALAAEVASRNITVNVVAPGFIESPMTQALNDKQREGILSDVPMGRLGTGADVAAAVAYLASAEAGYVTGQTLHVNGGMTMI